VQADAQLFDMTSNTITSTSDRAEPGKQNQAQRSISYMMGAVLEFGKVSGVAELIDRIARLCRSTGYSPYNALLMLLQRPAATYVLPAHQWAERYGYVIRPGEQPMVLLQPGGPLMFLLDVSQVEPGAQALPLPQDLLNPYAMSHIPDLELAAHWIEENAKFDGVRVVDAPLGIGFAGCVSPARAAISQRVTVRKRPVEVVHEIPVRYDVELNRSYSPTEKLMTLAHELGHVYCGHLGASPEGHWKDRHRIDLSLRELEAESVARVVMGTVAPGVDLPDHLHQYFDVVPDLEGVSLEVVLRSAGRILDIAQGWGPRWKSGARSATSGPPAGA
jgi:hypothetical protein